MRGQDSFLESKIQTPSASGSFLVRERLIRKLEHAEERLIIVNAGMGYGKTVLLTHYARRYPEKCAWYHLNGTDNDVMVFVRNLSKSVARIAPEFSPDFSRYLALDLSEELVRDLAVDISCQFHGLGGRELCLILDDFQTIENGWIFQFLNTILENCSEGLRLFLCMKSSPPGFCARYLLERSAMVLGPDALAFNDEEVRSLIREYAVPEELDRTVQAIQRRMEGWPAGVSFTTLFFRQRQARITVREIEQTGQQKYLQDYFMYELFRKLPYELQCFLTSTSVLDYLRPDVCNALLSIDNAAGKLSYLERENLFILRISGEAQIYRCHSLFREFLSEQLQPGQRRQLLEQTTDFYLRTTDKAQAAEYAIACGDWERLQTAVETAGQEALEQGRLDTLHRWLEELWSAGWMPSPKILLLQGMLCERTEDWQDALTLANQVAELYPDKPEERCVLEAKLLRSRVLREHVSVRESLAVLEELLPALRPERTSLAALRRQAREVMLRNLLDLRQYSRAQAVVEDVLEEGGRPADGEEQLRIREMAAICAFITGDYRRAIRMYVVLRSAERGALAAPYYYLYQAVTGRAGHALDQFEHSLEELRKENISRNRTEMTLLYLLVEQLAAMEEDPEWALKPLQHTWQREAGNALARRLGRALENVTLSEEEEDELFRLESGEFITVQDGVRWLAVRRRVRRGDRERALELCRRTRPDGGPENGAAEPKGEEEQRDSAFLAFLSLEEALLLRRTDPAGAEAAAARCAPYLAVHRLVCPGLTEEESDWCRSALAGRGGVPLPGPETEELPEEAQEHRSRRVRVCAFGRFRVLLPDGRELSWRTRKAEELFACLFHQNGAAVERERLLDILWPQSAPANATSLLHTSIYSIRKNLAPFGLERLLQREKKGYCMDMSLVESDREEVDAACEGDPEDGMRLPELYGGAYLEDIDAPWAEDSRAWYAGAFLSGCRSAAERCMDRGEFREAADCLRAAVRQEPYDEHLSALLIRCYAAIGEIKNAMLLYNRYKETLAEELGAEPGDEITHTYRECLLRRLGSGRTMT